MHTMEDFRARLVSAFPPRPFSMLISTHDECGEGIVLKQELHGKSWDQVSPQFVESNSASLPLLAPDALVAFLPAWLLRAQETIRRESLLTEFTMYFLCPGNADEGWNDKALGETVRLFNKNQRSLIGEFLRSILRSE